MKRLTDVHLLDEQERSFKVSSAVAHYMSLIRDKLEQRTCESVNENVHSPSH